MTSATKPALQEDREMRAGVDDGLTAFISVRARLFGIAYRILGRAAEAEDIVQEAWLRWQATDRVVVLDPSAFLATATTRLAINARRAVRSRRENYMEPLLFEPIDTTADPGQGTERGEAVTFGISLLLEKLSHQELATYMLREAFDYSYRQIAELLNLSEVNTRQLVTRARKHIIDRPRLRVNPAEQRRLFVAFMEAAQQGDFASLERLLA